MGNPAARGPLIYGRALIVTAQTHTDKTHSHIKHPFHSTLTQTHTNGNKDYTPFYLLYRCYPLGLHLHVLIVNKIGITVNLVPISKGQN